MQMKRFILALAAVASISVMAAPANAQFGSGAYGMDPGYPPPPPYGYEGFSPYPPHYGPYVGPFGGDALYGGPGPGPGYIEHEEMRPHGGRDFRDRYYRRGDRYRD
jgi:hypothetical protein